VLAGLVRDGHGNRHGEPRDALSPEARAAVDLFEAARGDLDRRLHDCVGGRELTAKGFAADVDVAADLDASTVVPVLTDGAFAAG
jgi:2-phosphosulfolactate phosphatase